MVLIDDGRRIISGLNIKTAAANRRRRCPGQSRATLSGYAGSIVISAASPWMAAELEPASYKPSFCRQSTRANCGQIEISPEETEANAEAAIVTHGAAYQLTVLPT